MIDRFGWEWSSILGEMNVEDPQTKEKYVLIIGYQDSYSSPYVRVWEAERSDLLRFRGGASVNYVKAFLNVSKETIEIIKDYAMRMEKMKVFI